MWDLEDGSTTELGCSGGVGNSRTELGIALCLGVGIPFGNTLNCLFALARVMYKY